MLRLMVLMGLIAGNPLPGEPVVPHFSSVLAVDHDTVAEIWQAGTDGVFAVLANDMDLDGDIDVLLNYHRAGIAIFENTDPGFTVFEPAIPGATRLGDGSGAVLFATDEEMLERIHGSDRPGIYIWRLHRSWHFLARFSADRTEPVSLDLWAPRFGKARELDPAMFQSRSATEATLVFDPSTAHGVIELGGGHLEILTRDGGMEMPIFVGPGMHPIEALPVILEHPDPHGVAWAQVSGTAHPDLFVSQGANVGGVVPPAIGKLNRHFEYNPLVERPFADQEEAIVPRGFGRTRRIEWVDVDNDGTLEAYMSNMSSSNALLVRDKESGRLRDAASRLALDFVRGATSMWMDVDQDSFQDLVLYEGGTAPLIISNDRGQSFSTPEESTERLMTRETKDGGLWTFILAQLDYNGDGLLDLWAGRSSGSHFLYRGNGEGFTPVGPQPSLGANGARQDVLVFDANNDGWVDVLLLCDNPMLFLNREGDGFDPVHSAAIFKRLPRRVLSGAVADMNGDGWLDLILATAKQWNVYLNEGGDERRSLSVDLKADPHAPIGALVRVHYSDGHRQVQRYGSNRNSRASQVVRPLHFGRLESATFSALEILWPGSAEWVEYDVPADGGSLELSVKANR